MGQPHDVAGNSNGSFEAKHIELHATVTAELLEQSLGFTLDDPLIPRRDRFGSKISANRRPLLLMRRSVEVKHRKAKDASVREDSAMLMAQLLFQGMQ